MSELRTNLIRLQTEQGINQSELASRTGVGQPVINRILSGDTRRPTLHTLKKIAAHFCLSIEQLIGDEDFPEGRIPGSFNPKGQTSQRIPLLTWEKLQQWPQSPPSGDSITTVYTELALGDHAYAVTVEDNTMGFRFPIGTVLLVNFKRKPQNEDFVVVQTPDHPVPIFRQLLTDGANHYLKCHNLDYFKTVSLTEPYKFLGVMVQARMDFTAKV